MDRVPSPDPLEARLDRLEQRLAGIESRLDRLVAVLDQAAPAIAMATDTADEWARRAQSRGVDLDAHAAAAGRLAEAVTAPPVVARVVALADRLEQLEPAIDLASRLQDTVGMAADTLDELAADAIRRGVDLDATGHALVELAARLARPEVSGALLELVDALPALSPVVQLATQFEPTLAMVFDMVDEHVAGWAARGIDAESRVLAVARIVQRLTDPAFQGHLEVLLDAAPGLMAATRTGELFGHAVDAIQAHPPAPIGPVGLIGALTDPDVQRAVGFAVAVARRVGADLVHPSPSTLPTRTA